MSPLSTQAMETVPWHGVASRAFLSILPRTRLSSRRSVIRSPSQSLTDGDVSFHCRRVIEVLTTKFLQDLTGPYRYTLYF